jgi:GntR family transcriptional regulator, rspAB operon transcriptional repressor
MARPARGVVQVQRLSDQVYELIRDDLKSGEFVPGQRLLEVELADRYKVSRTPIREALFQLSREGLLSGNERGYVAPTYSRPDIIHRLEVKRLLDPRVAQHVASEADPSQIKALTKLLGQQVAAHESGKAKAFVRLNQETRELYLSMCRNQLLARCLRLVDDQFDIVRSRIHDHAENRARTLEHETRLTDAIAARDPEAASAEMHRFLDFLEVYFAEAEPAELTRP